jgi:hypothetical protein
MRQRAKRVPRCALLLGDGAVDRRILGKTIQLLLHFGHDARRWRDIVLNFTGEDLCFCVP